MTSKYGLSRRSECLTVTRSAHATESGLRDAVSWKSQYRRLRDVCRQDGDGGHVVQWRVGKSSIPPLHRYMSAQPGFVLSQVVAFGLGVLACWAFWYVLLYLTPSLKISPQAVYNQQQEQIEIKVANFGRRQIADIEAQIAVFERGPEGRLVPVIRGELVPPNILALEAKRMIDVPWCIPTVFIFVCTNGKALSDALVSSAPERERRLVFTVSAQDAVSGTKKFQRVTFPPAALIAGSYERGLTFAIVRST